MAGVQSLERAFGLLEVIAAHRGAMSLSELATSSGLPPPTLHRLARTLVDLGYLRQEPSRRYALGPRLFLLAESSAMMLNAVALPHLATWWTRSARRPTWPCSTATRWRTSPRRPAGTRCGCSPRSAGGSSPHCTAVGKALLAHAGRGGPGPAAAHRPAAPHAPHGDRPGRAAGPARSDPRQGYAMDEGEQEVGVRCIAVKVPESTLPLAISVSGPRPG